MWLMQQHPHRQRHAPTTLTTVSSERLPHTTTSQAPVCGVHENIIKEKKQRRTHYHLAPRAVAGVATKQARRRKGMIIRVQAGKNVTLTAAVLSHSHATRTGGDGWSQCAWPVAACSTHRAQHPSSIKATRNGHSAPGSPAAVFEMLQSRSERPTASPGTACRPCPRRCRPS